MLKVWELECLKAEREVQRLLSLKSSDFLEFTNCFHNCIYILKGIYDVSPKEIRCKLRNVFFPDAVKMLRESKMHGGDDFLKLELSGIPGIQSQGSLRIKNDGKFILFGIEMPKGEYEIGKEFITLNGEVFHWTVPVIRLYNFREINEENMEEKKYIDISEEFKSYDPISFIQSSMAFYKAAMNVT